MTRTYPSEACLSCLVALTLISEKARYQLDCVRTVEDLNERRSLLADSLAEIDGHCKTAIRLANEKAAAK